MPEARDLWRTQGTGVCHGLQLAVGSLLRGFTHVSEQGKQEVQCFNWKMHQERSDGTALVNWYSCATHRDVPHPTMSPLGSPHKETKSYSPRHASLLPRTLGIHHSKLHHTNISLQSSAGMEAGNQEGNTVTAHTPWCWGAWWGHGHCNDPPVRVTIVRRRANVSRKSHQGG